MELSISSYYTWLCGERGSCWWSWVSPCTIPDYVENEVAADGAEYLPLYLLEAEQHGIHSSSPRTIKSTHERWRALIFSFPKVLIHSSILGKYLHLLSTFSFLFFQLFMTKDIYIPENDDTATSLKYWNLKIWRLLADNCLR